MTDRGIPIDRLAFLLLLSACQAIAAPAHAEVAWPELCARLDRTSDRPPDEVRRYRMRLNDEPAGREVFRFWREGERIRVVVETELVADILIFSADFRHCRDESWRQTTGGLQLVAVDGATNYAVPFKPDYEVHIERDPGGDVVYRGSSTVGSFEERYPASTGVVSPWSVSTVDYHRVLNLFEHASYQVDSRLVGRATIDGEEVSHYALAGEWPRHLWYDHDGKMIRFCAEEPFGTYIETTLEAYADRKVDALGLSRPCAAMFE